VIGYLGSLSFVIVYFGSLVCGSLLTILFHKDDYNYRAVGASSYRSFIFGDIIAAGYDLVSFIIPMPAYLLNPLFTVFYLRNES
jgi:membrane associated rhomboid family serine protease